MNVFIAYAKADVELAESVAIRLNHAGHKVFFDRSRIPPGGAFDAIIRREIERSEFLLFLASPESLAAGAYPLTELDLFKKRYPNSFDRVLTIRLRGTPNEAMPVYLRSVSIAEVDGNASAGVTAKALDCLSRLTARSRRRLVLRTALCLFCATMIVIGWYLWTNGAILLADSDGPKITVLKPQPQSAVRPGQILVQGRVDDASLPCRLQVLDKDAIVTDHDWEVAINVTSKTTTISVVGSDRLGNKTALEHPIRVNPVLDCQVTLVGSDPVEGDLDIIGPGVLTIHISSNYRAEWNLHLGNLIGLGPAFSLKPGNEPKLMLIGETLNAVGSVVEIEIPVQPGKHFPGRKFVLQSTDAAANQVLVVKMTFRP